VLRKAQRADIGFAESFHDSAIWEQGRRTSPVSCQPWKILDRLWARDRLQGQLDRGPYLTDRFTPNPAFLPSGVRRAYFPPS
jgi:hypothetical protein